ncbi:MAG: hypothetical protein V4665_02500 [Patescibacteria group bacterium]
MENKFGVIFQIIASIIAIVISVLGIIYKEKFLELQKKYFSKHKDFMNRKMLEGLESKSDKSNYLLIIVIATFLIILAIIQLISLL